MKSFILDNWLKYIEYNFEENIFSFSNSKVIFLFFLY